MTTVRPARLRALTSLAVLLALGLAGCTATAAPGGPDRAAPSPAQVVAGLHSAAPSARPSVRAAVTHAVRKHHRRRTTHPTVHPAGHRARHAQVPRVDLPDRTLTPGRVLTRRASVVCRPGYASSVRDVSSSTKESVYARYGVPHTPYAHEVDHLVSLELGGSNAVANLWPEPYAGRWGARTKDVLENRLHDLVCAGALSLPAAQRLEARDWVAAYRRFVGTPPVSAPVSTPVKHRVPHRRHHASGCEPGYSGCLPRVADLDCADVPAQDKPVRVTGSDPYRLDADGDGLACES